MSHQALSESTPPLPTDTVIESTPLYSSFEHFEPGLVFLSNDPSPEDRRLALRRQQKKQQKQQQRELSKDTAPQDDDTSDLRAPSPEDSDFVDLLYVVDSAGHTTVMDISGPLPGPVPPPTPQPTSSEYSLPAEHDVTTQTECLPPLSAAFKPPSTSTTTIIAGSDSAHAIFKSPALKDEEEADERAREAKLMSWWPKPEADELKVERL
jgi:hypothetical protein